MDLEVFDAVLTGGLLSDTAVKIVAIDIAVITAQPRPADNEEQGQRFDRLSTNGVGVVRLFRAQKDGAADHSAATASFTPSNGARYRSVKVRGSFATVPGPSTKPTLTRRLG